MPCVIANPFFVEVAHPSDMTTTARPKREQSTESEWISRLLPPMWGNITNSSGLETFSVRAERPGRRLLNEGSSMTISTSSWATLACATNKNTTVADQAPAITLRDPFNGLNFETMRRGMYSAAGRLVASRFEDRIGSHNYTKKRESSSLRTDGTLSRMARYTYPALVEIAWLPRPFPVASAD
ncbi:hypothetical protein [Lacipirellula sp.]|uniref:hypothetical protein n=1 Tax=Lacipirellula sp. TaxID=2691419 RepID=UPI003D13915D